MNVLRRIADLLSGIGRRGGFAAECRVGSEGLHLEVRGVGPIRFPVSPSQAERLREIGRPARYGRGERTLLDRRVRDTREIPRSRVKIDRRGWNAVLLPALESLGAGLGLSGGRGLRAELHAMLVYGPGQFFLPHQDSEKADEMVATLVVTLPSTFRGGELVVKHRGEELTSTGSDEELTFVAFYADCRHEVRPVKEGYRIVLTYNLMLEPGSAGEPPATDPAVVEALGEKLREHFETPRPPRFRVGEAPLREPADRCVYLLDHQYTERGLSWARLKGGDAARASALRAAAERTDCEAVLALADVHETWSAFPADGWDGPAYGPSCRWEFDEDRGWSVEGASSGDDPDLYELSDFIERSVTLLRWMAPPDERAEPVRSHVHGDEVCWSTPSLDLTPYAAEYEGYMGNWGNTMDRWYRRAAVVLWPRERAFTVRAEASPSWAVRELERRIGADGVAEARRLARSMLPSWDGVSWHERRTDLLGDVMDVAAALGDEELAAALLDPFTIEDLGPGEAPRFVTLVARYGEAWSASLLSAWSGSPRASAGPADADGYAWFASIPRLCEGFSEAVDGEAVEAAAWVLLLDRWEWIVISLRAASERPHPRDRRSTLTDLAGPILAVLEGAALARADDVRDGALWYLCHEQNEWLLPCLLALLRKAESMAPDLWDVIGLEPVRERCIDLLESRLATPARSPDDWAMTLPEGCGCELCGKLSDFLADADERQLEWPLAKEGRKHLHRTLDAHDLPVRHQTRRSGRPYTLVLTKMDALFEREAIERRLWREALDRLRAG